MNLSRLATLAVFFMMVMSAFVTVPTYNVGADEHDEDDRDDGDVEPEAVYATMTMESLEDWMIEFQLEMPIDWSNDIRYELSDMCEMMLGTDSGEINQECFDHWVETMMSDDEHGHDDEFRCPPEMDDATCTTFTECFDEGNGDMFECMTAMYNYCYDNNSEMCDDFMRDNEDDGGQFVWGVIAYEAGHIDATTLMDEYIIPEFGDFMDDGDDGSYEDSGRPVLYDVQTFDVDSDGELIIHTNFLTDVKTTPDFVCGNGEEISFQAVNDGNRDCEDGADEQWYDSNTPDDTSDDCQEWNDETCEGEEVNWFDCHDGSEVWINQVNNWEWNCINGEDEYQEYHHYWWGDVYLFEGDLSAGITDFGNLENVAFGNSYCDWGDDNETYVHCDDFMEAELFAGTWSLVTIGSCQQEWDYDDEENWVLVGYDCHGENDNHTNIGPYSHKLQFGDARWAMNGSIHHESMEMENFPHFDTWNDNDKEEFVMYQTQSFSIDTDSSVSIFSAGWHCYDWDEDGVDDECYGQYPGLYIYHGEDLIASNKNYYNDDMFCPVEEDEDYSNCGYALLEVDLVAGDYMVYTTFDGQASYYNNIDGAYVVVDGEESDEWDGYMSDNHWEWNEGDDEEFAQTVAYDGSVYDLVFEEFWNEAYDFEWYNNDTGDNPKAFEEEFGSVYDLYENYENVLETEGEGCDGCTGNLDTMDAETSFDITSQNEFENWASNYDFDSYWFQFMDENENDVYDSGEVYAVSSEGYGGNGGEEVLVEGTADRKHMPEADYHDYDPVCYDEETGEEIDCDDVFNMFIPIFMIAENATHYEDGNLTAEEAADNVVELFYILVEMGIFDDDGDHEDYGEDGYWGEYYGGYCEWEGDEASGDGDTRWYCKYSDDEDWDTWWYYCEVYDDGEGNDRWVCTDDFGQSPVYESSVGNTYYKDGGRPNDIDGDGTGDECPFDMDNPESPCHVEACSSGPDNPDCQNYVSEYCDNVDDDGCDVMFRMVCYDSENDEVRHELMTPADCESAGFMWVPVADDGDDNPPLLDGIIGVSDPEDTDPIPMSENMVGALSDNEDKPMLSGTSFKLHFAGVDESLDIHSAHIPIGDDGLTWHVEMILLEDYEVLSCEGCEDLVIDGSNAKFSADEPVTVHFAKGNTEECDEIVTVGDGGYSFEPAEITISEGDTVCWIWKGTTDVHNVVEIATKFDADMNLEDAKIGFYSGESANTVDFRHTFTENDKTHYYVCEPHAGMGMVGTVTVGNGTSNDPIEAIAEESGLPSISFAVGALVLVGAAGLRRRIH